MIEMAAVVVEGRERPLLEDCSLRVDRREIHALIGPAHAGKSVAIDVLMGRRKPSHGAAQILGLDCAHESATLRTLVTCVPAEGRLDLGMSLRQHVSWILRLANTSVDAVAIRRALRSAEIPDRFFDGAIASVPTQFRILAWLAIADLRGHQVILIDEPTGSLSRSAAERLRSVLLDRRHAGASILLATRDERWGRDTADAVTMIDAGRVQPSLGYPTVRFADMAPRPPRGGLGS